VPSQIAISRNASRLPRTECLARSSSHTRVWQRVCFTLYGREGPRLQVNYDIEVLLKTWRAASLGSRRRRVEQICRSQRDRDGRGVGDRKGGRTSKRGRRRAGRLPRISRLLGWYAKSSDIDNAPVE
jgi:hypothetical protein